MDCKFIVLAIFIVGVLTLCQAQSKDIPYQDVKNICETCVCLSAKNADNQTHHLLSCTMKKFTHILPRWPKEFGTNHTGIFLSASFSGNTIGTLQQLPGTDAASLTFSCRHCGIQHFQVPTFMDVPNIKILDLSWNQITADELTPDVFRGPFWTTHYEPIGLVELDLSHNQLHVLNKKLFEHTPNLTKLNLSYNKFSVLDLPTTMALASATSLEVLDLSNTGIKAIGAAVFNGLVNLKTLNLAGNEFTELPADLQLVGKTLETLNVAGNKVQHLTEQSFLGLKTLRRLNISDMAPLRSIAPETFTRLETLEYLYCAHNIYLETFDLDGLMQCNNLMQLDISYCSINTLTLTVDLKPTSPKANTTTTNITTTTNGTSRTLPLPWPRLHVFEIFGNPWMCDCGLMRILDFMGAPRLHSEQETRCVTPYILAGSRLSNLTVEKICSMQIPKKYRAVNEDPPRFLRKRYIILTAITASVVIVLGLMIGFVVVCIRRRLKRDDFGIEPIRYTSVRSSNLSAFSHVNPNAQNAA